MLRHPDTGETDTDDSAGRRHGRGWWSGATGWGDEPPPDGTTFERIRVPKGIPQGVPPSWHFTSMHDVAAPKGAGDGMDEEGADPVSRLSVDGRKLEDAGSFDAVGRRDHERVAQRFE